MSGRTQMQEVVNGASLGSGNALELYFGLGQEQVERVLLRWPDGTEQQIEQLTVNQRHEITYGEPFSDATAEQVIIEPWQSIALLALSGLIIAIWGYFAILRH
jgi:hypothetical protein